jgi:sodium/hydrogen antiporter
MQVEVEVQENAYAPEETTVHSLSLSEEAARGLQDMKGKVSNALRHPDTNFENALHDLKQTVSREAQRAEGAAEEVGAKAKRALSPRKHHKPSGHEEDEEWMSDTEGDGPAEAGASRQKSRSPKFKPPKLAVLRPNNTGRRRMSIRRGMLGARVPPRDQNGERSTPVEEVEQPSIIVSRQESSSSSSADQQERGRRPRTGDSRASSIRLMHHRVDSLRSIDTRREASPARSVRWADEPDAHERPMSGASTPGILSPVSPATPLPGSAVPSDDEEDVHATGHQQQHHPSVRFNMPQGGDRGLGPSRRA